MEDVSQQIQSIDDQIAALAKQKSVLLEQSRGTDLDTCKNLIKKHGFSKAELGFVGKAGTTKGKATTTSGKAKYANPEDKTATWNGHGRKPGWFVEALGKGVKEEDMLIKA